MYFRNKTAIENTTNVFYQHNISLAFMQNSYFILAKYAYVHSQSQYQVNDYLFASINWIILLYLCCTHNSNNNNNDDNDLDDKAFNICLFYVIYFQKGKNGERLASMLKYQKINSFINIKHTTEDAKH